MHTSWFILKHGLCSGLRDATMAGYRDVQRARAMQSSNQNAQLHHHSFKIAIRASPRHIPGAPCCLSRGGGGGGARVGAPTRCEALITATVPLPPFEGDPGLVACPRPALPFGNMEAAWSDVRRDICSEHETEAPTDEGFTHAAARTVYQCQVSSSVTLRKVRSRTRTRTITASVLTGSC